MSENKIATKADLQRMYNKILPYLGGTAEAGFTPVGTVIAVMGNSAPANYLACNGQVVNIADYPVLADYFEAQFGAKNHFGGNGTTTFAVPDLRGEFLRGTGTNSHANQGSGAAVGVHQDGTSFPTYNGAKSYSGVSSGAISNYDTLINQGGTEKWMFWAPVGANNSDGYYGADISSRPTNTSVLFCIATHNIFINPELQYSTQEQVVGTWIDGKPLYQKTIDCGALPNSNTKDITIAIANSIIVRKVNGLSRRPSDGMSVILPRPHYNSANVISVDIIENQSKVRIITQGDYSAFTESYITIQYTKTTD